MLEVRTRPASDGLQLAVYPSCVIDGARYPSILLFYLRQMLTCLSRYALATFYCVPG